MQRKTVILELVEPPISGPAEESYDDRLARMRRVAGDQKRAVLEAIEALKALDPALNVEGQETIFLVLQLETASDEVLERLRKHPLIKSLTPASSFRLAAG